ncbi:MAG: phosphatase PAP2 family protein [Mucilaginibacter polytrichastri]|nr:phosphatase PAP2 family protein [Mucilaginibacter polytrichastri]
MLFLVLVAHTVFAQNPADTSANTPPARHIFGGEKGTPALAYLPPVLFLAYGAAGLGNNPVRNIDHFVYADRLEDMPHFSTQVDNYLQFAPAAAVYALNFSGVPGRHNFADRTMLYVLSTAFMGGSVYLLKNATQQLRPNGNNMLSFPSGHTATAFAAAEFLFQEYGDRSPWYGIAGYGIATATGILRVYNNEHWFSNIIAGAGVGILSTKLSYLVYPWLKARLAGEKNAASFHLVPVFGGGITGMMYVKQF